MTDFCGMAVQVSEPLAGTDIDEAINVAMMISNHLKVAVTFSFNGVNVYAHWRQDRKTIKREWEADMELHRRLEQRQAMNNIEKLTRREPTIAEASDE